MFEEDEEKKRLEDEKASPLGGNISPVKPTVAGSSTPSSAPVLTDTKESASITGAPGTSSAGGQAKKPGEGTSSGRFVSLQRYMKANQPAKLAGALQSKIGAEQAKATGELSKQTAAFEQAKGEAEKARTSAVGGATEAIGELTDFQKNKDLEASKKSLKDYMTSLQESREKAPAPRMDTYPPVRRIQPVRPTVGPRGGGLDQPIDIKTMAATLPPKVEPAVSAEEAAKTALYESQKQRNPVAPPKTTEELSGNVQSALDLKYGGPTKLVDQEVLLGHAANLGNISEAVKTEKGQSGLLAQYLGGKTPNIGASSLDTMLLQSNQQALRNLAAAGAEGRKFGAQLGVEAGRISEEAKAQQDLTNKAVEDVKAKLGTGEAALKEKINTGIAQLMNEQKNLESKRTPEELRAAFTDILLKNTATPDQAKIIADRINWDAAVNDPNFISKNIQDITTSSFDKEALDKLKTVLTLQGRKEEADQLGDYIDKGSLETTYGSNIEGTKDLQNLITSAAEVDQLKKSSGTETYGMEKVGGKGDFANMTRYDYVEKHPDRFKNNSMTANSPESLSKNREIADQLTTPGQKQDAYNISQKITEENLLGVFAPYAPQVKVYDKTLKKFVNKPGAPQAGIQNYVNSQAKSDPAFVRAYNKAKTGKEKQKLLLDKVRSNAYYGALAERATYSAKGRESLAKERVSKEGAISNILEGKYQTINPVDTYTPDYSAFKKEKTGTALMPNSGLKG